MRGGYVYFHTYLSTSFLSKQVKVDEDMAHGTDVKVVSAVGIALATQLAYPNRPPRLFAATAAAAALAAAGQH